MKQNKISALGICMGASTVTMVELEGPKDPGVLSSVRIRRHGEFTHEGNPRKTLVAHLNEFFPEKMDRIAVTGRKFRKYVNLSAVSESEATEKAFRFSKPAGVDCPAVVSAGGETFMVYVVNPAGRITNVLTGNKCASGTGEFFLQQLRRMDVTLEQAKDMAATKTPHHVSGRCSVFCKSDCTHATNKGVPKDRVVAGLCKMMANKILELLKKIEKKNIMVVGGTSKNHMMVHYLEKEISGLIIPETAAYFEALGAALWALENLTQPFGGMDDLFVTEAASFEALPPLKAFEDQVVFKTMERSRAKAGDKCILGLDVGSTTTKAVLLGTKDNAILASIYLRTNGDPVGASRRCYAAILSEVQKSVSADEIEIYGLGVCGSGRQIAGLHALTDGVINEIIAHAEAAVFFDPQVDTLFEIGGQDAKYTYITNGVPSDYAMNEACSAGTGSFLEESALETLGVKMEDIADVALKGGHPPNFNDQCAAFIASDIKNAIHENVAFEDVVAGLVYSICMNYSNRVKGNRPVGEKVFMQGGVCYNKAVPLAMASLVGKPIVVPPEPGLMGAFGVALEVKKRIAAATMSPDKFDLAALAGREVVYGKSFICGGGKEKCDRGCEIAMIHLEGKKFPFGGACNRYVNLRRNVHYDVKSLDLVRKREEIIREASRHPAPASPKGRIGITRSFMSNTYLPLYTAFFANLGYEPMVAEKSHQEGIDRKNAAFCHPAELSHGFFYDLICRDEKPDALFLPHFSMSPGMMDDQPSKVCPFVQGEPYFLKATFKKELDAQNIRILTPVLNLNQGMEGARKPLVDMAVSMGESRSRAVAAFKAAAKIQEQCFNRMRAEGQKALARLEADPEAVAVVACSRPYSGLSSAANMGIPHKFASRGVSVIPLDFLPLSKVRAKRHMYWGLGQAIMKAARFTKNHPRLFGVFITHFSCGPDSFLITYFRDIMGKKPSLTLELDSHTADAGLETRIEAFLDIVEAYRKLEQGKAVGRTKSGFSPAACAMDGETPVVVTAKGERVPFSDPRVTMLIPSMGRYASEALAAVFQSAGMHAVCHPPADEAVLKMGRANTSCKECLPLILTTGALINYARNIKKKNEILVYFMATGSGPCRFGQYYVFMEDLVRRLQIPDTAMFHLSSEDSYKGMGDNFTKKGWWAVILSDTFEDMRSMILVNAKNAKAGLETLETQWQRVLSKIAAGDLKKLEACLNDVGKKLGEIPKKQPLDQVPTVALTGEIYVRRDALSRRHITEYLAENGFAAICAPVAEWMHYADWLMQNRLSDAPLKLLERPYFYLKRRYMVKTEAFIKKALAKSRLIHPTVTDVDKIMETAAPFISKHLGGETVLTVGSSLMEVAHHACGVIAIGPFGCMPNRLAESLLKEAMQKEHKLASEPGNKALAALLENVSDLPFLAIESDGSPFPQIITANLENFMLRARRLHGHMRQVRAGQSLDPGDFAKFSN